VAFHRRLVQATTVRESARSEDFIIVDEDTRQNCQHHLGLRLGDRAPAAAT